MTELEDIERAERRLEQRSTERRAWRARARRRADRRARVVPWLLAGLVLPVLGAAGIGACLQAADRDLSTWTPPAAELALAGLVVVPAVLSAWVNRREAWWAAAWAALTLVVELALVFWVVLLALDLGPR